MWVVVKGVQDCACQLGNPEKVDLGNTASWGFVVWSTVGMKSLFFPSRQGMGVPREMESWE